MEVDLDLAPLLIHHLLAPSCTLFFEAVMVKVGFGLYLLAIGLAITTGAFRRRAFMGLDRLLLLVNRDGVFELFGYFRDSSSKVNIYFRFFRMPLNRVFELFWYAWRFFRDVKD